MDEGPAPWLLWGALPAVGTALAAVCLGARKGERLHAALVASSAARGGGGGGQHQQQQLQQRSSRKRRRRTMSGKVSRKEGVGGVGF